MELLVFLLTSEAKKIFRESTCFAPDLNLLAICKYKLSYGYEMTCAVELFCLKKRLLMKMKFFISSYNV